MGAPSGAIRAGRAFVEMFADSTALIRTLEAAKKRVLEFGKFSAKIGATAAAAGASVFTPIAKMFTSAVEEGADIAKLASRFGTTAEQISTLRGAFAQAGVGANEFAGALDSLAGKISHAADGNGFLLDSLQSLGTGKELMGKGLDEQLDIIAERIKAIPHEYDRMRAASELGMGSMLRVLEKGKAGLDEYRAAAVKNGDAMSGEQAKQALEVQKEYNRVMLAAKSTLLEVGKALLPTGASFTSIGERIRDTLSDVREWIQQNKEIIITVTTVAGAFLTGGLAIAGFGAAVSVAAPIIGGLVIAIKAVVVTVGLLFNPITWIAAAALAAAAGLAYLWSKTDAGSAVLGELKAALGDVVKWFKSGFSAIGDAFKAGDWTLAFKIGCAMAKEAWYAFVYGLTAAWGDVKSTLLDGWDDVSTYIEKVFLDLAAFMIRNVSAAITGIVDAFNSIAPDAFKIELKPMLSDEDVNKARDSLKDKADADRTARKKARDKTKDDAEASAYGDWDVAWKALEELKKEAAEAAAKEFGGFFNRAAAMAKGAKGGKQEGGVPSMSALSESAKGTFGSASIAQSLGYGDNVGQRQLDAQMGIQENTKEANQILRDMYTKLGGKFS